MLDILAQSYSSKWRYDAIPDAAMKKSGAVSEKKKNGIIKSHTSPITPGIQPKDRTLAGRFRKFVTQKVEAAGSSTERRSKMPEERSLEGRHR